MVNTISKYGIWVLISIYRGNKINSGRRKNLADIMLF